MLLRLGYEVFVPKIVPFDEANRSASVTYEYDSSLTIPQGLLKKLNHFDFYTQPWPKNMAREINEYFGTAIAAIFPEMVEATCNSFDGLIYLRIFGLEGDKTYADRFETMFSDKVFRRIRKGTNIRLAASIANTIDHEPLWVQRISLYLPQGLPLSYYQHENKWRGDTGQIFFVCPRIKSHPYYNKIYQDFKRNFGDLPHIIAGAQPVEVTDDAHVTGFLEQEEYLETFMSSRVMFYHSMEERHLHYHPIEAAVYGLPLIYMSGGVLEFLAKRKLPGCCDTFEEARLKIRRILNGDEDFISDVVNSQKILLQEFGTQYVEDSWREKFSTSLYLPRLPSESREDQDNEKTHVGLWMHETNPGGFTGEGISRLLAMIILGAQERADLQIHIASVSWVKQAVADYLEDLGVDTQRIIFDVVNETPPLIYQVYDWWINRKPRKRRPLTILENLHKKFLAIRSEIASRFVVIRPLSGFLLIALITLVALPFLLIFGLLLLILYIIKKILDLLIRLFHISQLVAHIRSVIGRVRNYVFGLAPRVFSNMVNSELKVLAEKVITEDKCSTWFFAYPNNKFIHKFTRPTVVAVPDIVYLDFPTKYSKVVPDLVDNHYFNIKQTITQADKVITFSNYVRENQVIKSGFQLPENIHVIPHAPIETRPLISSRSGVGDDEMLLLARRMIKGYLRKETEGCSDQQSIYLRSLNLGSINYLFVSSQSRLHKNHLNLIKAYRILLRERYVDAKLVFTGAFSGEMQEYVDKEKLHLDVLSMHYMPARIHAAFYACAHLTVAPTLFEGGFPFVFSESLSVNTPVVLSDIPVVREVLSPEERSIICFDPYNVIDMVNRISWALENHSYLLDVEGKILSRLKTRTWQSVADEYLDVFNKVSQ